LHFAHATGFHAATYRRLLGPLADRVKILAHDLRGHGRSPAGMAPEALRSWDRYRDDLIRLIEEVCGAPVFLAGHSLGGVISLAAAAHRPELARGLVLLDPVIFPRWFNILIVTMKALGQGHRVPISRRAAGRRPVWPSLAAMQEAYARKRIFRTWDPAWIADYLAEGTSPTPDGQVALTCTPEWEARSFALTEHRSWRRLPLVRCPITLIHGGQSDTFLPAAAREFARHKPQARMVRVAEATHFVPMEFPELVRAEMVRMIFGEPSR